MKDFDPFDPAFVRDPSGIYAAMRAGDRALRSERLDGWMITRYRDAVAVLRDAEGFSSDDRNAARPRIRRAHNPAGRNLIGSDPPQHDRLRRILQAQFTPRAAQRWSARMQAIADELLDAALADDRFDVVQALAIPLPLRFTGELLGVPARDLLQLRQWSEDEIIAITGTTSEQESARLSASSEQLHAYWYAAIERAKSEPQRADDLPRTSLLSLLSSERGEQEQLGTEELVAFLTLMLRASTHTTTNLIANGLLALLDHPAELERLHEKPELWPNAIDELLRFAGPVQSVYRVAMRPTELHGVRIAPGERVHVVLAAANGDPSRFPDADRLDLERDASGQLGFGFGIHACLGAHVAGLEVRAALGALLARLPRPALRVPRPALQWQRVWSLRELASLPVGRAARATT